jgi:hypothetical protein
MLNVFISFYSGGGGVNFMKHFKGGEKYKILGSSDIKTQTNLESDAPLNPQTNARVFYASPRTSLLHSYHRVVIVASCSILAPVLSQIFES